MKTTLRIRAVALATLAAAGAASCAAAAGEDVYARRAHDWRNGAVVYQVIVDRFVPPANLEAKRALYPAPKVVRPWGEVPKAGTYLADQKLNSAELEFWGGDLKSADTKIDYVRSLGADVLYLNPIHLAYTNHKYDAFDYRAISPEYGTRDDFRRLAADVHARGMKLVLDGVFNHMGRTRRSSRTRSRTRRARGATGSRSGRSTRAARRCGRASRTCPS